VGRGCVGALHGAVSKVCQFREAEGDQMPHS
jgi:hypothetical protein